MSTSAFYVLKRGKQFGPFTQSQLIQLAKQGKISAESNVRNGSAGKWYSAGKIRGLRAHLSDSNSLNQPPIGVAAPVTEAPVPKVLAAANLHRQTRNPSTGNGPPVIIAAKCTQCAAPLLIADTQKQAAGCRYCGAAIIAVAPQTGKGTSGRDESSHSNLLQLAELAERGGNFEEAYHYYSKVLEAKADHPSALFRRSITAGMLSTLARPRLLEMCTGIKHALACISPAEKSEWCVYASRELFAVASLFNELATQHHQEFITVDNATGELIVRRMDVLEVLERASELDPQNTEVLLETMILATDTASRCNSSEDRLMQMNRLAGIEHKNIWGPMIDLLNEKGEAAVQRLNELNPDDETPTKWVQVRKKSQTQITDDSKTVEPVRHKSRTKAALFACFFGIFGLHKFYLRRPIAGCIYIALTIACLPVFGVGLIPGLLGWIEGIYYYSLTDEEFQRLVQDRGIIGSLERGSLKEDIERWFHKSDGRLRISSFAMVTFAIFGMFSFISDPPRLSQKKTNSSSSEYRPRVTDAEKRKTIDDIHYEADSNVIGEWVDSTPHAGPAHTKSFVRIGFRRGRRDSSRPCGVS
jgi:TM2 domain-containing membrane protein YozV